MTQIDFIVAGAQKGGSTHFARLLGQVNGIRLPREEDPCFETPYFEAGGVDRLRHNLRGTSLGEQVGIKRPNYLGERVVPQRVNECFPNAKIFFVLRDPVARARSDYLHKVQYGKVPIMPVDTAMLRLLDGDDFNWARTHQILDWGKYRKHLERWLKFFDKQQLLVVSNNTLRSDPTRVVVDAVRKLGCSSTVGALGATCATNSAAGSLTELRLRRYMHKAINDFNPQTGDLLPRTANPARLAVGGAFRSMADLFGRLPSRDPAFFLLKEETHGRLLEYYREDIDFLRREFDLEIL